MPDNPEMPAMRLSCLLAFCLVPCVVSAAESLVILPPQISLTGTAARQTLLVQQSRDGVSIGPATEGLQWTSSNEQVVKVEQGVALPVGNGEAMLTVKVGEQTATVPVQVTGLEQKHQWNFRNQVQSVLSKAGCNSGACHGAAAGKSGFKLSLRGYAPEMDFLAITRDARGRRIVPGDPGRSLLLTKPTGAIPHKGGIRFKTDSREYRAIAEWIAAGHPGPADKDPRLEKLEILPELSILKPGVKQQLVVLAHFSDGHVEDVTTWAKYTSSNLSVVNVNDTGLAEVTGHGEGAIVAWYLSNNVVSTITVPYAEPVPAEVFETADRHNFVDDLVLVKLRQLNLPPSPLCSDETFLRRVYLDTIGVLPTLEETNRFLSSTDPERRRQLIDELLTRPEFVDYWAHKWADLLLVSGERLRPKAVESYYAWIRGQVEQNTPWDQFARQIVTAKGSTYENGAANFFALHQDPLDMAETTSMTFLGMSIQCAKCHDHPLEKWTNDDYYGMANLFARVRGKGWGGDFRSGDGLRTIFTMPEGELIQPSTGEPQPPKPLEGEALAFDDTADRRIHLANWLTAAENPYFSKAIVNRVWANFFSVGIVEKVDDLRLTNPPSNPELLNALADYLVQNQFDLKKLMREILQSSTYQRSSQPLPGNTADDRFYSRYYPRRLKAEVILDALSQVTRVPTKFKDQKDGLRALQLPDVTIESYFLETFGRPNRLLTCECERSDEPSMTQVLHIVNGETLNGKLKQPENCITTILKENRERDVIIRDLYLTAFSRQPTERELTEVQALWQQTPPDQQREFLEDLHWSLLSSREFLFNH